MKTLLTKLQNKRKEEKGFTLVELLVVIAILAILASVSIVGYVGFTQRAKESNANTELAQAKTMIVASLLDGTKEGYLYQDDKLYVLDSEVEGKQKVDGTTLPSDTLKNDFELNELKGVFTLTLEAVPAGTEIDGDDATTDYLVKTFKYTLDEVTVEWVFEPATGE